MQYTIVINQVKACEWGLNIQQAALFSFVYGCPSWCRVEVTKNGEIYHALSKGKIIDELPLLTDKTDTAWRMLRKLQAIGVIELSSTNKITLVRLTEKGKTWNHQTTSEKIPTQPGPGNEPQSGSEKNPIQPDLGRKKIRSGSEKFPTNQYTSNQNTSLSGEPAPRDDSGQPTKQSLGHFAMSLDWMPNTEQLDVVMYRRGTPKMKWEWADLADFTAHFSDKPGMTQSANGWLTQFAKWVDGNRRNEKAKAERHKRQQHDTDNTEGNRNGNAQRRTTLHDYDPAAARARDAALAAGGSGNVYPH